VAVAGRSDSPELHRPPPNVKRVSRRRVRQLAELSGFSQQYISGLEQGRRNPTVVSLYELATALGVSHMELVRSAEDE